MKLKKRTTTTEVYGRGTPSSKSKNAMVLGDVAWRELLSNVEAESLHWRTVERMMAKERVPAHHPDRRYTNRRIVALLSVQIRLREVL